MLLYIQFRGVHHRAENTSISSRGNMFDSRGCLLERLMKILLLIAALVLLAPGISSGTPDPLDAWYRGYNEVYFNNELPNVLIDHSLTDDRFMALTSFSNGFYHIQFNPKFGYHPNPKGTSITELRNLLHESCHVEIFIQNAEQFDDHGSHWQSCMYRLAKLKAFENLW